MGILTNDLRDYSNLIGATLRDADSVIRGEIVEIDTFVDGYGHQNSFVVTDDGFRVNARGLLLKPEVNTKVVTFSQIDPASIVRDEVKDLIKFVDRDEDELHALNRKIQEDAKPKAKKSAKSFMDGIVEMVEA